MSETVMMSETQPSPPRTLPRNPSQTKWPLLSTMERVLGNPLFSWPSHRKHAPFQSQ